jgi:hypothetical protein
LTPCHRGPNRPAPLDRRNAEERHAKEKGRELKELKQNERENSIRAKRRTQAGLEAGVDKPRHKTGMDRWPTTMEAQLPTECEF